MAMSLATMRTRQAIRKGCHLINRQIDIDIGAHLALGPHQRPNANFLNFKHRDNIKFRCWFDVIRRRRIFQQPSAFIHKSYHAVRFIIRDPLPGIKEHKRTQKPNVILWQLEQVGANCEHAPSFRPPRRRKMIECVFTIFTPAKWLSRSECLLSSSSLLIRPALPLGFGGKRASSAGELANPSHTRAKAFYKQNDFASP